MRRGVVFWAVLAVLTGIAILVSLAVMEPSPPKRIVLATGQPGGAYDTFGADYKRRLARNGLGVQIVNTGGSVDNLERLARHQVDVAFAQGGTYMPVADPRRELRGLAAIYLEPLWVFYRGARAVDGLGGFTEQKIAIGPVGSGTDAVARALLGLHGFDLKSPAILNLPSAEARRRLEEGALDVAFFVSSYRDATIAELLHRRDVLLLGFPRDVAYARTFRYLTPVKLTQGLLDLRNNIPAQDTIVLAPAAMLVAREDLHPRVVELILNVAQAIHSPGSLIDPPSRFPTLEGVDIPIHETAETYLTSGESFLSRVLPYWALRRVLQLKLLVLPVLVVWLPLLKILPMVYGGRGNRLMARRYAALRDAERSVVTARTPDELQQALSELDRLRGDMDGLAARLPLQQQREVYQWRLHLSLVQDDARARLHGMETPDE